MMQELQRVAEGHYKIELIKKAEEIYNGAYIAKYEGYAKTDMGKRITEDRVGFVENYGKEFNIVDVGIGSGAFREAMGCYGYDVNPHAVKMLKEYGHFVDIYDKEQMKGIDCLTFWDSFEHIEDPSKILDNLEDGAIVIMSIPIFVKRGLEHLKGWKHYREDEHIHYFTNMGLLHYMKDNGFMVMGFSEFEIDAGREDIYSYAFKKGM